MILKDSCVTKRQDNPAGEISPLRSSKRRPVDPMFDGHLATPLLKMTVQQRLDWIDEMMRLRAEWKSVPPDGTRQ
jgi:hypothetical protein